MLLIKVFRRLNRDKVRYLVVGGVAGILYGNPRFTKDLDIWVDPAEDNLKKMINSFKFLKFTPRNPVKAEEVISPANRARWRKDKGMLAFTFINPKNPFENIDILFEGPLPFKNAYRKKKIFHSGKVPIPAISRAGLIEMKRKAGREQDLSDIEVLKRKHG